MIEEIRICNLGVIEEATLTLGPGFTAITGETGAGKTMVVTALGLLLGGRSDASVVRVGSTQTSVDGSWLIDENGAAAVQVRETGGELDNGELILSRTVTSEGRSKAFVGGRPTPAGILSEIGESLVVVHGQSDQMRLRSAAAQHEALDRYAGSKVSEQLSLYKTKYSVWKSNQKELDLLTAEAVRRAREADDLRRALEEIEQINPIAGEDVDLAEKAIRLTNLEELRLAAAEAHEAFNSEDLDLGADIITLLYRAKSALDKVVEHDSDLKPISEEINNITFAVNDVAANLSAYVSNLDDEGARDLETIQNRRAELTALARKYGPTLEEVIAYAENGSSRLFELDNDTDRIEHLKTQVEVDFKEVVLSGTELTKLREKAAAELSQAVTSELGALAMANSQLVVDVSEAAEYTSNGHDIVLFQLASRAGAEARPLGKGASGGELSRVMLAIEVVIAGNNPVPTFIFDEVDAGVGGASAIEIGRRLATLSKTAQVIVVTHLAQVAAFANNHLTVVKDSAGAVTVSSVKQLTGEDRIIEMARLLSGLSDSESGLAHARELLEIAHSGN